MSQVSVLSALSLASLSTIANDLRDLPSYDESQDSISLADEVHEMPSHDFSLRTSSAESGLLGSRSSLVSRLQQEMEDALHDDRSESSNHDNKQHSNGEETMHFDPSHFREESSEREEPAVDDTTPMDTEEEKELDKELSIVSGEMPQGDNTDGQPMQGETEPKDDNNDSLESGLAFPDVEDVMQQDAASAESGRTAAAQAFVASGLTMLQSQGQALATAMTSKTVTDTVSGLMASTMAGLSSLREHVVPAEAKSEGAQTGSEERSSIGSKEAELLEAEFEFLDQEDFQDMDKDKSTG